jgi:hypothetical protein
MGTKTSFRNEKLIIPLLISEVVGASDVLDMLESYFGKVDHRSDELPFDYTDYYSEEMGPKLRRIICSFEKLVDPATLPDIKESTNRIEGEHLVRTQRRVNLDPGLITLERLVLASTKDNGRRIPLRDGIYAEITLVYHHGEYHATEWTYPDYRSDSYLREFEIIRTIYKQQLKQQEDHALYY